MRVSGDGRDRQRGRHGGRDRAGFGALAAVARAVAGAAAAGDAFVVIARELRAVLDVPECVVCEWDRRGAVTACRSGEGETTASAAALPASLARAAAAAFETGEPVLDGGRLCVPFGVERPVDGCIVIADPGRDRFAGDEVALVRAFGDLAALVAHRARTAGERAETGRASAVAARGREEHHLQSGRPGCAGRPGARGGRDARRRLLRHLGVPGRGGCAARAGGLRARGGLQCRWGGDRLRGASLRARDPLQRGAGGGDALRPGARRGKPGVDGAVGGEDMPVAAPALRQRGHRRAGGLRDGARARLHRRGGWPWPRGWPRRRPRRSTTRACTATSSAAPRSLPSAPGASAC